MDALPNLPPSPLADHIIAALRTRDARGRGVVLPWLTWTNGGSRCAARTIGGDAIASCVEEPGSLPLEQRMAGEDARLCAEGYLLAEDVVSGAVAGSPLGKVLGDIIALFEQRAAWTRARARAWKHAAKKAYRIARHNGREVDRAGVYIALLRSRHGAMPAEAAQDALANIAQWLTAQGMKNNASVVCNLPDLGRVTLSVQRHEGKTPNDMIDEAQAETARIRKLAAGLLAKLPKCDKRKDDGTSCLHPATTEEDGAHFSGYMACDAHPDAAGSKPDILPWAEDVRALVAALAETPPAG